MTRTTDRILQKIIERIKYTSQNGRKPITIEDLESQFRFMPEMEGLNREDRYALIKSKLYRARKKSQRFRIPIRRLWRGGTGIRREVYGLKVVDTGSKEDCLMLDGDLEIDKKKRDGFAIALDERVDIAEETGALTSHQVKRFQLIGGEGKKKIKELKRPN